MSEHYARLKERWKGEDVRESRCMVFSIYGTMHCDFSETLRQRVSLSYTIEWYRVESRSERMGETRVRFTSTLPSQSGGCSGPMACWAPNLPGRYSGSSTDGRVGQSAYSQLPYSSHVVENDTSSCAPNT